MGGTHVQVVALYEPRQMGNCFVNTYRINGTAYREAKADSAQAGSSPRGDVVQSLRDLQKLRQDGVITPQEFDRLKTKIISAP
jgi:Short C-terminal domain